MEKEKLEKAALLSSFSLSHFLFYILHFFLLLCPRSKSRKREKGLGMVSYLAAVWRCRYFWLSLVGMDLRTRYRRSVLGLGWSLLHPLAMAGLFCLVLRPLLMPGQPLGRCAAFFLCGLSFWHFLVNTTVMGCQALLLGEPYIRQYPAPIAIYFLRTALGSAFHFLIALGLVVVISAGLTGTCSLVGLLALVPAVLLLLIFGWAVAVLAGFANVYFRDTQHLCEVGLQVLFYATPILYESATLTERRLGWLLALNPLTPLLEIVRTPVLLGEAPPAWTFLWAAGAVALFAGAAVLTLVRCQRQVVFYL
jgi:lipopolysaccharide transport system permease protein